MIFHMNGAILKKSIAANASHVFARFVSVVLHCYLISAPCGNLTLLAISIQSDHLIVYFIYILQYFYSSIVEFPTVSPIGVQKSSISQSVHNSLLYYANITWTPQASQYGLQIFCFSARDSYRYF